MLHKLKCIVVIALLALMIPGCWAEKRPASIPGYADKGIKMVAVMPVKARGIDVRFAKLMRDKVLSTLYFKGYPKLPKEAIDTQLVKVFNPTANDVADISPQAIRSLLNVDAVLYVTAIECKTDITWLYAVTNVSADFILRDGKTGETIWKNTTRNVERNVGITRQRLEQTVYQILEPAIQQMVEKALQSLPDGQGVG